MASPLISRTPRVASTDTTMIGSDRVAEQAVPPGTVLPQSVHGGPGRAGGGEELGGLRGLAPYMQRTAVQGFQGFVAQLVVEPGRNVIHPVLKERFPASHFELALLSLR